MCGILFVLPLGYQWAHEKKSVHSSIVCCAALAYISNSTGLAQLDLSGCAACARAGDLQLPLCVRPGGSMQLGSRLAVRVAQVGWASLAAGATCVPAAIRLWPTEMAHCGFAAWPPHLLPSSSRMQFPFVAAASSGAERGACVRVPGSLACRCNSTWALVASACPYNLRGNLLVPALTSWCVCSTYSEQAN